MASLLFVSLLARTKLGHGLLSGQYSKPPVKSELIEQVMKEEHKVCVPSARLTLVSDVGFHQLAKGCCKFSELSGYRE